MPTLSALGIGSNLDVNSIVSSLMAVEQVPLQRLDRKEAAAQVKISSYSNVKSSLSKFQSTVQGMGNLSRFNVNAATVKNAEVASASVTSEASAGSYSLEVETLARAHKIVSGAYASSSAALGSGTLTIQVGTYDATGNTFSANPDVGSTTITLDPNSSLEDIRDAINDSSAGVRASIVNDGSGYRLVTTSKSTGLNGSIRITTSDIDGNNTDNSGLSSLAYDPTGSLDAGKNQSELLSAEDAVFYLDGLRIQKSSNSVDDALDGVTLELSQTNVDSPTTLNITRDTNKVKSAMDGLVKAYNELNNSLSSITAYDAGTGESGALQGEATMRLVQSRVRQQMSATVEGMTGRYTSLPSIGFSFDRDGNLTLDETKFEDAMNADPNIVARLFAGGAATPDANVSYVSSTEKTKTGQYALNVGSLLTSGDVVGSAAASTLTIDGTNDTLTVDIDGTATTVSIPQQTYADSAALASAIQTAINSDSAILSANLGVQVTETGGVLTLTSLSEGASSSASVTGGTGATALFGAAPVATAGTDLAASFGGIDANVSGNEITGAYGNGAEGLKLRITGGATGDRGAVTFTAGFASQLDSVLEGLLDSDSGIQARIDGLNSVVEDIADQRISLQERLEGVQARYEKQFGALDQMLSQLQSTSEYLAQQLANLPTYSNS